MSGSAHVTNSGSGGMVSTAEPGVALPTGFQGLVKERNFTEGNGNRENSNQRSIRPRQLSPVKKSR